MIASENVASEPVRRVTSSDLGHRYAEGWPGERVYAGCRFIDQIELQAIELGKKLFRAEFIGVRPTSGDGQGGDGGGRKDCPPSHGRRE